MKLLHGSTKKFDRFKIDKDLCQHNISTLAEGFGIYMTLDETFASSYGNYLYTIDLNKDDIQDFTSKTEIINLIKEVEKDTNCPLIEYLDLDMYIEGILLGEYSATSIGKDICDILDSNDCFYSMFADQITFEDDCLMKKIQKSFNSHMKDVIKYYDKSFNKCIYICIKNPNNLNIVDIKKIY